MELMDNNTLVKDFKNRFEIAKHNDLVDMVCTDTIKSLEGDLPTIAFFAMSILHDVISECPVKELRQYLREAAMLAIYCECHNDDTKN
jgi:hypothetical protein